MLSKSNWDRIEALISKSLTDSVVSHDKFVLINNVLKEYDEMKNEIKNLNSWIVHQRFSLFIKQCDHVVSSVEKNTESKNSKCAKTKNGRIMLFTKYAVCDSKNSKFIKEQEASELLSSLGIQTPLSKIPLVGPLLI